MKITTKFNIGDTVYFIEQNKLVKGVIRSIKTSTIICASVKPLTNSENTLVFNYEGRKQSKPYTTISYNISEPIKDELRFRPVLMIPNVTEDRLFSTKEELLKKFAEDCE